jgi:hypothetical protein
MNAWGTTVPKVSTRLSLRDVAGAWKVRWNIGRNRYSVEPGLYAVGAPNAESPVLVSANYKLSFDRLRGSLSGVDCWILVLDTRGVNVWCAAGKGTFGTRELERRIADVGLSRVVSHRVLIVPQLGASGVSARQVEMATGFRVKFGPVRARDIPAYLSAGRKKNDGMRRVRFGLADRLAVAPVELVQSLPILFGALAAACLLGLPADAGYLTRLWRLALPFGGAAVVGTIVFAALLPFLPFRAFALKGAALGLAWGAACALVFGMPLSEGAATTLVCAAAVSYMGMNFTGASTFTCQPGAELEVRLALVPQIACAAAGIALLAAARIFGF